MASSHTVAQRNAPDVNGRFVEDSTIQKVEYKQNHEAHPVSHQALCAWIEYLGCDSKGKKIQDCFTEQKLLS